MPCESDLTCRRKFINVNNCNRNEIVFHQNSRNVVNSSGMPTNSLFGNKELVEPSVYKKKYENGNKTKATVDRYLIYTSISSINRLNLPVMHRRDVMNIIFFNV